LGKLATNPDGPTKSPFSHATREEVIPDNALQTSEL
jgi:hypothetical protein